MDILEVLATHVHDLLCKRMVVQLTQLWFLCYYSLNITKKGLELHIYFMIRRPEHSCFLLWPEIEARSVKSLRGGSKQLVSRRNNRNMSPNRRGLTYNDNTALYLISAYQCIWNQTFLISVGYFRRNAYLFTIADYNSRSEWKLILQLTLTRSTFLFVHALYMHYLN